MTDLVSRLLEAIAAKEAKARAAQPGPWTVRHWKQGAEDWKDVSSADYSVVANSIGLDATAATVEFIHDNDPSSVLRRCAADRAILAIHHMGTVYYEDETAGGHRINVPEWYCKACVDQSSSGIGVLVGEDISAEWPCATLRHLALGYGLEVTE